MVGFELWKQGGMGEVVIEIHASRESSASGRLHSTTDR